MSTLYKRICGNDDKIVPLPSECQMLTSGPEISFGFGQTCQWLSRVESYNPLRWNFPCDSFSVLSKKMFNFCIILREIAIFFFSQ